MRIRKQKGFILLLVLFALITFSIILLYYVNLFNREKALSQREKWNYIAGKAAEAGVEDALYYIKQDMNWQTGFNETKLSRSNAVYSMSFNKNQAAIPYSTNNSQGTVSLIGYGGREVPPGSIHLVSMGNYAGSTVKDEALISVSSSIFNEAIFVDKNINLNGTVTIDSFDSSQGSYAATHTNSGGNIGTNSAASGSVDLVGNVDIFGTVNAGPGAVETTTVSASGNSTYQGFNMFDPERALTPYTTTVGTNLGSINASRGITYLEPGTYTNITGRGQSVIQLKPGKYVITGNIDLSGGSILQLSTEPGKVEIYAMGNISIAGGGIVNTTLDPKRLIIYGGPETKEVVLSGGAQSYFGVYAPAAEIEIRGNSQLFGAIVGDSLKLNGTAQIHFDKSMTTVNGGGSGSLNVTSRW